MEYPRDCRHAHGPDSLLNLVPHRRYRGFYSNATFDSDLGGACVARLWTFHVKDYSLTTSVFDFVFTVSNFRPRVINLQPLEESFEVSCFHSSDGVVSLYFRP